MTANDIETALLSISLDKICATEVKLNSGERRVDFWTLEPSFSGGFRATAYEIKVSRGDFRRDSEEKQALALRYCDRFFYAAPAGVIGRADVPDWAGLMEWDGNAFRVVKRAPRRHKAEPDWEFVVALLRGSRQVRRDVGLFQAQIAFLQHRLEQIGSAAKHASNRSTQRWFRQYEAVKAKEPSP